MLPLRNKTDIEEVRQLLSGLGNSCSIVDFEEHIQMQAVQESRRLWRDGHVLVGFGYVDGYCNLWFETKIAPDPMELEDEIINWGIRCQKLRNSGSGTNDPLDHCCSITNYHRRELMLRNGFSLGSVRSLTFSRPLVEPVEIHPFPPGYSWHSVNDLESIESLVDLHQAAFGTKQMTVEYRRAMINTPQYQPELDLVAVAPNGSLVDSTAIPRLQAIPTPSALTLITSTRGWQKPWSQQGWRYSQNQVHEEWSLAQAVKMWQCSN